MDTPDLHLTPQSAVAANHWHRYAVHWGKLGPPLRPQVEDVAFYKAELARDAQTLLLGVTPEIGALDLEGLAVDNNLSMISAVWPRPAAWQAVQGDWLQLPLLSGSIDQVVGDGSVSMLRYPQDYLPLLRELSRVLTRPGKVVLRLFTAPKAAESVEQIRDAALNGKVQSFHALKWRLAMSLAAKSGNHNVRVSSLLALFNATFPERDELIAKTAWPSDVFDTVDVYGDSSTTFSFPPWENLAPLFKSVASVVRCQTGDYELGACCPIVVLEGFTS